MRRTSFATSRKRTLVTESASPACPSARSTLTPCALITSRGSTEHLQRVIKTWRNRALSAEKKIEEALAEINKTLRGE
jgi:hypothetical protein